MAEIKELEAKRTELDKEIEIYLKELGIVDQFYLSRYMADHKDIEVIIPIDYNELLQQAVAVLPWGHTAELMSNKGTKDNDDAILYYAIFTFFHRGQKSLIAIELKAWRYKPEYAG